jgi:spermidine/putrescine transport system permease protein
MTKVAHNVLFATPFLVFVLFWLTARWEQRSRGRQQLGFFRRNGVAISVYLIVAVTLWALVMIVLPQLFMVEMSFRPKLPQADPNGYRG